MYDYYCVDCGKKLGGEEICFNLAGMLGLEGIRPKLALVTFAELDALAGKDVSLYQPKRQRIAVTLKDFLKILGRNHVKDQFHGTVNADIESHEMERMEREMGLLGYSELDIGMRNLTPATMSQAEQQELTKKCVDGLEAHFIRQFLEETKEEEDDRYEDTGNYAACLWIEPILFEGEERTV